MSNTEIWKDIIGFEGYYKISNYGRVKSLDRVTKPGNRYYRLVKGQIIKSTISGAGYRKVMLHKKTYRKTENIHRLLAIMFLELPEKYRKTSIKHLYINHKDGNKLNNSLNNLEWCTSSENAKHCKSLNLINHKKGKDVYNAKAIVQYSKEGRKLKEYMAIADAAKEFNLDSGNIIKVCKGKKKSCGGFIWKYKY